MLVFLILFRTPPLIPLLFFPQLVFDLYFRISTCVYCQCYLNALHRFPLVHIFDTGGGGGAITGVPSCFDEYKEVMYNIVGNTLIGCD